MRLNRWHPMLQLMFVYVFKRLDIAIQAHDVQSGKADHMSG